MPEFGSGERLNVECEFSPEQAAFLDLLKARADIATYAVAVSYAVGLAMDYMGDVMGA